MYNLGKKYKIEIEGRIFYTAIILEEDKIQIKVKTIRDEELIITKTSIVQSKLMDDRIGEKYGTE